MLKIKKFYPLILTSLVMSGVFLSNVSIIYAEEVLLNNEAFIELNTETVENRRLIPVRELSEQVGFTVKFNNKDKSLQVLDNNSNSYTLLCIESTSIKVFKDEKVSKSITLDVPPKLIDSKTYVPIRAVCEALNGVVEVLDNGTLYINTNISSVDKEYLNKVNDGVIIYDFIKSIKYLNDRVDYISKNLKEYELDSNISNRGFEVINQLRLEILDLKNTSHGLKFKVVEEKGSKKFLESLDAYLNLLDKLCTKVLNDKNWSSFKGNDFIMDFIDLQVFSMKLESEGSNILTFLKSKDNTDNY